MLPSLRALQAFNAAARLGSFSRAADEMSITHGAVSRLVGLLEQDLGMPLFQRRARGVELTAAGQRLYDTTGQAFSLLAQGIAALAPDRHSSTLRVSLSTSLALKWLVARLPQFYARHPGIGITLDANDQLVDFDKSRIDVALRSGGGEWDGLQASLLLREELVAVAAPSLLARRAMPLTPQEILALPLVHDDFHGGWAAWARLAGVACDATLPGPHFNDTALLIGAVRAGQGVALVRRLLATDELAAGQLACLSDIAVPLEQSLYFVCRRGDQQRRPVVAFQHWLQESLAETAGKPVYSNTILSR